MLSLSKLRKVHMIGIKGTGMSALALALRSLGVEVTGSDSKDSFLLLDAPRFTRAGITIHHEFDEGNVQKNLSAVIVSSSHLTKNPEVNKARKLKIPILQYKDVIGLLSEEFKSIAVAGSHGKTTTTNMLAYVLQKAKFPVLAVAGPTSPQVLDSFPLIYKGDVRGFVFEADEYQNKLAHYSPFGVILTNVELDHPDYFKSQKQYEKVFVDFIKRIPKDGFLVYCHDDARARKVATYAECKTLGYGITEGAPYLIRASGFDMGAPFSIQEVGIFRTSLMGVHNVLNTAAVILAARELGITNEYIQSAIMSFRGSPRRLQKISSDPLIFDDYGHHPTEIKATIKALRDTYPDKKIWTVFHPHTYSRTKKFLKEFGASFGDSDHTIVLEIWGSAREKHGTVSSRDVVAQIKSHKGKGDYAASFEDAAALLQGKLGDNTLLLTIGAGDVWKLHALLK